MADKEDGFQSTSAEQEDFSPIEKRRRLHENIAVRVDYLDIKKLARKVEEKWAKKNVQKCSKV